MKRLLGIILQHVLPGHLGHLVVLAIPTVLTTITPLAVGTRVLATTPQTAVGILAMDIMPTTQETKLVETVRAITALATMDQTVPAITAHAITELTVHKMHLFVKAIQGVTPAQLIIQVIQTTQQNMPMEVIQKVLSITVRPATQDILEFSSL